MCLKASSQYDAVLCVALICEMRNFINILVIGDQIQKPNTKEHKDRIQASCYIATSIDAKAIQCNASIL